MKKSLLIMVTIFFAFTSLSLFSAGKTRISGKIENGLRILKVDSSMKYLNYTIYRGDYIVFEFSKKSSYDFKVPKLDIDTVMPRPESEKAYVKMKKSGLYSFTLGDRKGTFNVLELTEPNYTEVTAAQAVKLIENTSLAIIDVRTKGEFNSGHIENADLLPVQVLAQNINKIDHLKNEPVFLYCASGNRSTVAARILLNAGFTNIYNLRNGIGDWKRKGFPVTR